jgi:hypothetical protein
MSLNYALIYAVGSGSRSGGFLQIERDKTVPTLQLLLLCRRADANFVEGRMQSAPTKLGCSLLEIT